MISSECFFVYFLLYMAVHPVFSSSQSDTDESLNMSDEKKLIKFLLEKYEDVGIVGRPVYKTSETINVSYGLSLIQILDLDEKNQVLTTNVWSRYGWKDILLCWKPEEYGGIDHVRVPSAKIWTPDIVLYNYADTRLKEQREALVVVKSTGEVNWIPPAIYKSTCSIDISNFPFDEQECFLKFGSWTYDGFNLDVNFPADNYGKIDTDDYVESNEWLLAESPAFKNVKFYAGLDEPYVDLTFYLKIRRVAAFYNYILVLPCVLLSFLTLVIFWLPPESPAKVMLGMSVFVAFFVLLLLLADSTPPAASSIPLIGAYFCMNMILITLSTFLAVIIIQNHIRGDRKNKVPVWLKKSWTDMMLHWNLENYGGIKEVRVPVAKIWRPDIVLYNYADVRLKEHRDAMAVIASTGDVTWIPPAIFKSTCSIDILYFPFDVQNCSLKFGSWTYDGFKLNLNFFESADMDMTNYVKSNEWQLISAKGIKNSKYYPCCPEPYYDLTFTIIIKRIPIFHTLTLIIPCVLLSLLTLVSFWLPPETPAKILLGMNLFLAFFLLLKLLAGQTPASSNIPLIGAYFCLNMVLITLSSFISATVINLYRREDKKNKVPSWLKKITIDGLSRLLCMEQRKNITRAKSRPDHVTHHVTHVIGGSADKRKSHHEKTIKSPVLPYNKWEPPITTPRFQHADSPLATQPCTASYFFEIAEQSSKAESSLIEMEVKEIKRILKNFTNKLLARDTKERNAMEWRLVALSIDRLFFAIYLLTIFVSTVTIYVMCYIYYDNTKHEEEKGHQ